MFCTVIICANLSNIGYIDEVVGPIGQPYYTVMLYPAYKEKLEKEEINIETLFKGESVYFVEKTKKLIFWNNIINQKARDASNMYDEEVNPNSDDEFSDDEQEKVFKKIVKKVKNHRKRHHESAYNLSSNAQQVIFNPSSNAYPPKKRDQK